MARYPHDLWETTAVGDTVASFQLRRGVTGGVQVLDRMRTYLEDSNGVSDEQRQAALRILFGGRRFTFDLDRERNALWCNAIRAQRKRCGLAPRSSLTGLVGVPQIIHDATAAWCDAEDDRRYGDDTDSEPETDDGGAPAPDRDAQLATLRWLVRTFEALPDEERAMSSPATRVDDEAPRALHNPLHVAAWLSISVKQLPVALDLRFTAGCAWPKDCTTRLPEEHVDPRERALLAAMAEAEAGATVVTVKGKESTRYPTGTSAETLAALKVKEQRNGDVAIDPTLPPPVTLKDLPGVLARDGKSARDPSTQEPSGRAFDASYFGSRRSQYPLYAVVGGDAVRPSAREATAAALLERYDANPLFLFDAAATEGPNRVIHAICLLASPSPDVANALAVALRRRNAASSGSAAALLPPTPDGASLLHLALDNDAGSAGAAIIRTLTEYYREMGVLEAALAAVNKHGLTPLEYATTLPVLPYAQVQSLIDAHGRGALDGTVRIRLSLVHGVAAREYEAAHPNEHDRPLAAALMERAVTDPKPSYSVAKKEVHTGFDRIVPKFVRHLATEAVTPEDLRNVVLPVWWAHSVGKTGTCADLKGAIKAALEEAAGGPEALDALDPGGLEERIWLRDAIERHRKERKSVEDSENVARFNLVGRELYTAEQKLQKQHWDGRNAIKKKEEEAAAAAGL
jgi:hypothetical protein